MEKMASIAEQEKLRSLGLEKELDAVIQAGPVHDVGFSPGQNHKLQQALQEKDRSVKSQTHMCFGFTSSAITNGTCGYTNRKGMWGVGLYVMFTVKHQCD